MEIFITKDIILTVIKKALSPAELKRSSVYWFPERIPKDTPVNTGIQSTPAPFDCVLVFIDLSPVFNWAHPCLYLLVGKTTKQIKKIESSLPPPRFYDKNSCFMLMKAGEIVNSDPI